MCERCGKDKELFEVNNGEYYICNECLEEEMCVQCEMCGGWFTEDGIEYVEGIADVENGMVCLPCIEDSQ